jgi:hypothetical protein
MKDDCKAFDSRIKLDVHRNRCEEFLGSSICCSSSTVIAKGTTKNQQILYFYSTPPSQAVKRYQTGMDLFDKSTITDNNVSAAEPWASYYRMAGTLSPGAHLAVGFDLSHLMWRLRTINYTNPSSKASLQTEKIL